MHFERKTYNFGTVFSSYKLQPIELTPVLDLVRQKPPGSLRNLIHLGDEWALNSPALAARQAQFSELYGAFGMVLRQYAWQTNAPGVPVFHLPLGYRNRMFWTAPLTVPRPSAQRKFTWSFFGTEDTMDRPEMIAAFAALGPRGTQAALSSVSFPNVVQMRLVYEHSIFVPSGRGGINSGRFLFFSLLFFIFFSFSHRGVSHH
jgi:hypothetical protein